MNSKAEQEDKVKSPEPRQKYAQREALEQEAD